MKKINKERLKKLLELFITSLVFTSFFWYYSKGKWPGIPIFLLVVIGGMAILYLMEKIVEKGWRWK